MDSWTAEQLKSMELSGNGAMNGFLEKYGVGKMTGARTKYESRAAEAYRDKLKCAVQGIEWKKPKGLKSSGSGGGGGGGGGGASSSSSRGGKEKSKADGLFPSATSSSHAKKDSASLGKTGYDLSTGQGSLLQRRYEESNDGWVPPPPPLPKGAKKGQFLHGLTPYQWVDALKQMSRQEDRTYHLKNMSEDERAQVVAAMSGQPIPARSTSRASSSLAAVAASSSTSDLKTLNPFGDSDSADDFFAEVGKKKKDKKDKKEKKNKKEKKEKAGENSEETDLERRMREAGEAAKALARERSLSARAHEEASTSVYAVPQKKKQSYSPQQNHAASAWASGSTSGKYSGFGSQPWDPNAASTSHSDDWQAKMKVSLQSAKGWLSGGLKSLAAKLEGQSSSSSAPYEQAAHAPRSYQGRPPEATYDVPAPAQQAARPPKPRGKPESFYSESSSSSSSESDSDSDAAPPLAEKARSSSTSNANGVAELEHGFTNLMD